MKERDFCYWLQGLFELQDPDFLNEKTTKMIKDHLALVFRKETPKFTGVTTNYNSDASNGTKYVGDGSYLGVDIAIVDITGDITGLEHLSDILIC